MSHSFYKVIHLIGIFSILLSLGGIILHTLGGGTRDYRHRKLIAVLHGVGLLLIFVAGFGLMARLGLAQQGLWPTWVLIKLCIWAFMATAPVLLYRLPKQSALWGALTLFLASLAAWTAIFKPFSAVL